MAQPIRINRLSPSPDPEAEFMAQPNLEEHIDDFLQGIAADWRPASPEEEAPQETDPSPHRHVLNEEEDLTQHKVLDPDDRTPNNSTARQDNEEPRKISSRNKKKCHRRLRHPSIRAEGTTPDVENQAPGTQGENTQGNTGARNDRTPFRPLTNREHIEGRSLGTHQEQQQHTKNTSDDRGTGIVPESSRPPTIRHKARCRFGPGRQGPRTEPPRPHARPQPRRWDASANFLPECDDEQEAGPSTQPDRVTLAPPAPSTRTPFDHYKATAAEAPRPNPYRFIQSRLGISEATFEKRIEEEIEALLKEIEDEKIETPQQEDPPLSAP